MKQARHFKLGSLTDRGEYQHMHDMHDRIHAKGLCLGSRDL